MSVTVSVQGLEEIDGLLARVKLEVRGKALARAIRKAGNRGRDLAVAAAPENTDAADEPEFPKLKESIAVKYTESEERVAAIVGPKKAARQGHLVEFGHRIVVGGKLGQGGRIIGKASPQPWFRPARDAAEPEVERIILEALRGSIKRLEKKAKRLEKKALKGG
jgi:HK97 gp10 family phage protein